MPALCTRARVKQEATEARKRSVGCGPSPVPPTDSGSSTDSVNPSTATSHRNGPGSQVACTLRLVNELSAIDGGTRSGTSAPPSPERRGGIASIVGAFTIVIVAIGCSCHSRIGRSVGARPPKRSPSAVLTGADP